MHFLLFQVKRSLVGDRLPLGLSLLGLVGLTAFIGLREKGCIHPEAKQTIVISGGASGACGSLAGQVSINNIRKLRDNPLFIVNVSCI